MAGDGTPATVPKPEESSQEQEKVQAENEAENQQPEHGSQPQTERQPPRPQSQAPLPPAHFEALKNQPLPAPPPQGVHFGPLPYNEPDVESVDYERPFYPRWNVTKIVFLSLSLVVSAVILGMGITIGMFNAPYYLANDDVGPADYELGTSASAAGLAVVITTWEFLKTWRSSKRRGLHPGSLVAFHLITWLLAVVAVVVTAIYATDSSSDWWYNYPRAYRSALHAQSQTYEQVLLAFDCALLVIHFVLFIGACVETNKLEKAKRKVVVVRVPVQMNGAAYPGGPHPAAYGPRPSFVPAPQEWQQQPGQQYPAPLVSQIPPRAGEPAPPPPAAMYGGYCAPGPQQNVAWASGGNGVPVQGYYAPALPPRRQHSNSAARNRNSRGEPAAPALASSSGSRRSQRLSQTLPAVPSAAPSATPPAVPSVPPPAAPPAEAQEQVKAGQGATERSA